MDDLETSRSVALKPIVEIAARLGLGPDDIAPYGRYKAKLEPHTLRPGRGKLVLVTAISPTPAGEGKTTTTIGLADALNVAGANAVACLREPSLGPCFGVKGGATGGGRAQVAPMEDINLHFTGDFHAITSAHNLLSALIDNHLYWGGEPALDPGRVAWRRVLDMNDRALRNAVVGLGGRTNGVAREAGFDITAASEVMAILCLAEDADDLKARLSRVVIGARRDGTLVHASELDAPGAMAALLIDAVRPNLVQTLEGTPAIVHGGPFANIAHGCNSVIATRTALGLADWVVTEAGFGADLGAEKFLNIKCRLTGLSPSAAVVVATVRALKMHGGVARGDLGREDVAAVIQGAANLRRHVDNVQGFDVPVVVALNRFTQDTEAELGAVADTVADLGVTVVPCDHWARGGVGALPLAEEVMRLAQVPVPLALTYPDDVPLAGKIEAIASRIYRAREVAFAPRVRKTLAEWEAQGFGRLPVCMAKTQYSFSADPTALGAPDDFVLPVREVRLSAGAGFIVAITGELMTMPGLPRRPTASVIDVVNGRIMGLS